jgi:tRNA pseudouridine55 synthase
LAAAPVLPAPVSVTTDMVRILGFDADSVTLGIACSSGFYVRSLAHDLGQALQVGAHLARLRRISVADIPVAQAMPLDQIGPGPGGMARVLAALTPLARMLPHWRSVTLTREGSRRAVSGCDLRGIDVMGEPGAVVSGERVRLLDFAGDLIGIGEGSARSGLLHPAVILV